MAKKKRTNPRRIPHTKEQTITMARNDGIDLALAMVFTAILDKGFMPVTRVQELWDAVNDVADSVAKGYVNAADMLRTLKDEYKIEIR